MKTFLILILFFLLNETSSFAQSGWLPQTSGTTQWLMSVYFTSSSTGWTSGDAGTILKTTNGGDNWVSKSSGTASALRSIHFPTSATGFASGDNGTIIKTTNGGDNWVSLSSGTVEILFSVSFLNSNVGWVVGSNGLILRTVNGGTNWISQPSGTTDLLFSVQAMPPQLVWAVGGTTLSQVILHSTNGGVNWTFQNGQGVGLYSVHFATSTAGCAVGTFGAVNFTTDGGTNWQFNHLMGAGLNSVFFISSTTGWISGNGNVYMTPNGGASWFKQETGTSAILSDVHFTSSTTGWVVGTNGTILKTTNGGTGRFNLNLTALLEGFYDPNSGIMIGDTVKSAIVYTNFPPPTPSGVEYAHGFLDSTGKCTLTFHNSDNSSPFFLLIEHRNSIATWSSKEMNFSAFSLNYDFTTSASKAWGDNMVLRGTKYCFYGGDVNQDGSVNAADLSLVDNDALNFVTGYVNTDITGDNIVDAYDLSITDNNAYNFVHTMSPYDDER